VRVGALAADYWWKTKDRAVPYIDVMMSPAGVVDAVAVKLLKPHSHQVWDYCPNYSK
jgi:hypothetical protein